MAKETVHAVRQTEIRAAQMEKEAFQRAETILLDAQKNAGQLVAEMTKKALEKAEKDLAATNQRGQTLLESSKVKAESEILIMKELAERKETEAINLVISSVIQGK